MKIFLIRARENISRLIDILATKIKSNLTKAHDSSTNLKKKKKKNSSHFNIPTFKIQNILYNFINEHIVYFFPLLSTCSFNQNKKYQCPVNDFPILADHINFNPFIMNRDLPYSQFFFPSFQPVSPSTSGPPPVTDTDSFKTRGTGL